MSWSMHDCEFVTPPCRVTLRKFFVTILKWCCLFAHCACGIVYFIGQLEWIILFPGPDFWCSTIQDPMQSLVHDAAPPITTQMPRYNFYCTIPVWIFPFGGTRGDAMVKSIFQESTGTLALWCPWNDAESCRKNCSQAKANNSLTVNNMIKSTCTTLTHLLFPFKPFRDHSSGKRQCYQHYRQCDRATVPSEDPTVGIHEIGGHVQLTPSLQFCIRYENTHTQLWRENQSACEIPLYQLNHAWMIRLLMVVRHSTTRSEGRGIELLAPRTNSNAPTGMAASASSFVHELDKLPDTGW